MKKRVIATAVVLSVALVLAGAYTGYQVAGRANNSPLSAEEPQQYGVGAVGSIAIPGYDKLTFMAGESTQYVSLENPAQNDCSFIISIALPDGTELYKSGLIAPGTVIDLLRLKNTPAAGVYENATLSYSCWSVDADGEITEINGANTFFTLEVIP